MCTGWCSVASYPRNQLLDLILDRVYWTGWTGLQMYSAWNVARDGMTLSTSSVRPYCFQLGEFSAGGDALDESQSVGMLAEVRDRLLQIYREDHPVVVLYSSGRPEYRSLARTIALSELADKPVPVYSNLWIPSMDGPSIERQMAPEPV